MSTLLAEVYGPDADTRRELAAKLRQAFEAVDFVVDVDDSYGVRGERMRFAIDQEALEYHGVEERAVYDTIGALVGGVKIGFSQRGVLWTALRGRFVTQLLGDLPTTIRVVAVG